jgi:trk system potassium uptake protein
MSWERGQRVQGGRRGDLRVRIARRQTQHVEVKPAKALRPPRPSVLFLPLGFAALIVVGTALLMLPAASADPGRAPFLVALFTATSAVCVTGLVVVDTRDYWNGFGEVVIFLLVQLGGLGIMTSSTLLFMLLGRRLSLRQRVVMAGTLGRLAKTPPRVLVKRIVLLTLAFEAVGAILLTAVWGLREGTFDASTAWRGLFTAVSAFNNAGFDIEGGFQSLIGERNNKALLLIIGTLVLLGSSGYAVWSDLFIQRRWKTLAVDTKIVLSTSAVLLLLGTIGLLVFEWLAGGVFSGQSPANAVTDAAFMSISARTAGFTALDFSATHESSRLITMGMMFIGGAPASTAGGIKVTTFTVLLFAILASVDGREQVLAFGRSIASAVVHQGLSIALLAVAIVFLLTLGLSVTESGSLSEVAFEATSAFGTTGLSTGITPNLSDPARLMVIVVMFIGRLGPLTIALALAGRMGAQQVRFPEEPVSMG